MVLLADQRRYHSQYHLFLDGIKKMLADRTLDFADIQPHYQAILTVFEALSPTRKQELTAVAPLRPMAFLQNVDLNDATLEDVRQTLVLHHKHIKAPATFRVYIHAIHNYFAAVINISAARGRDDVRFKHQYDWLHKEYQMLPPTLQSGVCAPPIMPTLDVSALTASAVAELRAELLLHDTQ